MVILMSKNIKQSDLDTIYNITDAAKKSLETTSVILVESSRSASVVGNVVGGEIGALIGMGGIQSVATASLGAGILASLKSSVAGGLTLVPLAIVAGIELIIDYFLFSPSEDEKKLNSRLKEAIEVQNLLIEKINKKLEEIKTVSANEIEKYKEKILELIIINKALTKEIKRLKLEYNIN